MKDKISELTDILEEEMSLYEESLEVASREKDAMQSYFLEGMLDCQRSRMNLNLRISELEERRIKISSEIIKTKGLDATALRLKDIAAFVDGETKERLEHYRFGMKKLLDKLSAVMAELSRIATSSLDFVDSSIKLLSGYETAKMTYRSNGIMEERESHHARLMKEV